MTFSVLKRHTNVIFGLFRGLFGCLNRLSASFTGSSQSHGYVGTNRIPTAGTVRSHEGNGLFPCVEQVVTIIGTTGYHEGNNGLLRRKQKVTMKGALHAK